MITGNDPPAVIWVTAFEIPVLLAVHDRLLIPAVVKLRTCPMRQKMECLHRQLVIFGIFLIGRTRDLHPETQTLNPQTNLDQALVGKFRP